MLLSVDRAQSLNIHLTPESLFASSRADVNICATNIQIIAMTWGFYRFESLDECVTWEYAQDYQSRLTKVAMSRGYFWSAYQIDIQTYGIPKEKCRTKTTTEASVWLERISTRANVVEVLPEKLISVSAFRGRSPDYRSVQFRALSDVRACQALSVQFDIRLGTE